LRCADCAARSQPPTLSRSPSESPARGPSPPSLSAIMSAPPSDPHSASALAAGYRSWPQPSDPRQHMSFEYWLSREQASYFDEDAMVPANEHSWAYRRANASGASYPTEAEISGAYAVYLEACSLLGIPARDRLWRSRAAWLRGSEGQAFCYHLSPPRPAAATGGRGRSRAAATAAAASPSLSLTLGSPSLSTRPSAAGSPPVSTASSARSSRGSPHVPRAAAAAASEDAPVAAASVAVSSSSESAVADVDEPTRAARAHPSTH
jgi:hypothetical protein